MTPYEEVLEDLAAEHAALDAVLAGLPAALWDLPTHAPGWLVRDQVTHLAHFDEAATRAIVAPDAFRAEVAERLGRGDRGAYERQYLDKGRSMTPAALLDWSRAAGTALILAARGVSAKARLPWYGPEMSAVSFLTARLMETWSHGLDIVDVAAVERPDTDRLRHVAFLGVRTRSFSYANRGLRASEAPVLVRLIGPSGAVWTFGDPAAADRIEGTATDFCRVVTQRRHLADTRLAVSGPNAAEWMAIAQAFAGPPGRGRRPGEFGRDGRRDAPMASGASPAAAGGPAASDVAVASGAAAASSASAAATGALPATVDDRAELVRLAISRGVATITLDSPANRNALSRRLLADLDQHVRAAAASPLVRVIVLTAAGPAFCSGADLKERREDRPGGEGRVAPSPDLVSVVTALRECGKPVVARINGAVRAGGIGLVCASDISVAVDTATFAFSEVRIGVAPAIIAVVALPRLGPVRGPELMLTGDVFDAPAAVRYGLINRAVPAMDLDAAVERYVDSLIRGGPDALAETKRLVHELPGLPTAQAFERMATLSARLFGADEARQGMAAYAEKRAPAWANPEGRTGSS